MDPSSYWLRAGPPSYRPPSTRSAEWRARQELRLNRYLEKQDRLVNELVADLQNITVQLSEAKKAIDKTQRFVDYGETVWANVYRWTDRRRRQKEATHGLLMRKMNDVTMAANEVQHSIANLERSLRDLRLLQAGEMQEERLNAQSR